VVGKHFTGSSKEIMIWVKQLIDSDNLITSATAIALNHDSTLLAVGAHHAGSLTEWAFFLDPLTGAFKYNAVKYKLHSFHDASVYHGPLYMASQSFIFAGNQRLYATSTVYIDNSVLNAEDLYDYSRIAIFSYDPVNSVKIFSKYSQYDGTDSTSV
jgi:hypothetical protein